MRFPKPFFRESKQAWYLQLGKRQISLGPEREEAFRRYRELMLHEDGRSPEPRRTLNVAELADLFLEWCQRHNNSDTYAWYKNFLQSFCDRSAGVSCREVRPFHVTRWLDAHPTWETTTRRCAAVVVKRIFNWGEGEGLLDGNPLKQLKKDPAKRRERILTADERNEILESAADQGFRDLLQALQETGCRPSEVTKVTAENVDLKGQIWTLPDHKTKKKTGRPRVIYLTPAMVQLTQRLMAAHPTGPLFRNHRGKPWNRNSIRCRFRRLRERLPHLAGVVAYTFRHSFVTDSLENGVGVAQVAELLGHTDTDMVMQHYQHLSEKRDHLLKAVAQATQHLAARADGTADAPPANG